MCSDTCGLKIRILLLFLHCINIGAIFLQDAWKSRVLLRGAHLPNGAQLLCVSNNVVLHLKHMGYTPMKHGLGDQRLMSAGNLWSLHAKYRTYCMHYLKMSLPWYEKFVVLICLTTYHYGKIPFSIVVLIFGLWTLEKSGGILPAHVQSLGIPRVPVLKGSQSWRDLRGPQVY